MGDDELKRVRAREAAWEKVRAGAPEEPRLYTTISGRPIKGLYTPQDLAGTDFLEDIGYPGEFPYTRGIHATGYRGKLWTMRMFAGFGSAEETNARFKYLVEHGQTGLSVAFDMPTLMGYDTDDPWGEGEFGRCGVAISSLADMEILFDGIPLDQVTTSMTINGPAAIIWAMYLAVAEKRGIPWDRLGGTIQNDILKEYIAQNEFLFPPAPSMRLVVDTMEFGSQSAPRWNTISVSGYHIREAGSTAQQELAFTLADGLEYVRWGVARGLDVDAFVPRISFFFNAHNDFFEEIAKYRAARRIWAREIERRYHPANPRAGMLRFHTQTAGCSLTAQQPENNVVRTSLQALAAVLGGTQSLHTNSLDEALALPSDWAVRIALRTQQIIAHESGIANFVDPLGGSYQVETLTTEMEQAVQEYFGRIEDLGGVIPAIERGFFQREIHEAAYRYQREVDARQRLIVGVNDYLVDEPVHVPILAMDPEGERCQRERLARLRRERDNAAIKTALARLRQAAQSDENLMPPILDAVRAYGTLGEITGIFREVFGEYNEYVAA